MLCRVCNSKMSELETIQGCRAGYLAFPNEPFCINHEDLTLYLCPECSHMQVEDKIPSDYYDGYMPGSGLSQYSGELILTPQKIERLKELT